MSARWYDRALVLGSLRSHPRLRPVRRILGPPLRWIYEQSERYVWHEYDLDRVEIVGSRYVGDLRMRVATNDDLPAIERIGVPFLHRFEEFCGAGGELWLADAPDGLAVAFWIFHNRTPLYPWLDLPPKTVSVEYTTVSPAIRGLGFGPAAITLKLKDLREAGYRLCVTKIDDTNRRSLRSAARVGFRPTALMYQRRVLGHTRTYVEAWTPFARHLGQMLQAPGAVGVSSAQRR